MTREEMMDKMVREFGFEDEMTVWFCSLAEDEKLSMTAVEDAFVVAQVSARKEFEED